MNLNRSLCRLHYYNQPPGLRLLFSMAASLSASASLITSASSTRKAHRKFSLSHGHLSIASSRQPLFKSKLQLAFQASQHFSPLLATTASSDGFVDTAEENETVPSSFEEPPVKFILWVIFWASVSLTWFAASGDAKAASDSIRASSFGLKIASKLQSSGWPDEVVVFTLAMLPVLELRGAIPVGYWMQLKPVLLTVLSVLGNIFPVPFIVLYLRKFAIFVAGRNRFASQFLDMVLESAKKKTGPVEEFQWLGLMLFVAVPFPGTGAWTGAIIASILEMPFWSAVSANFCGVVLAGLLVNLLVNLGLMYAIVTGVILFFISTFMWTILRNLRKSSSPSR